MPLTPAEWKLIRGTFSVAFVELYGRYRALLAVLSRYPGFPPAERLEAEAEQYFREHSESLARDAQAVFGEQSAAFWRTALESRPQSPAPEDQGPRAE